MSTAFLANRLKYHTASRVGAKETDPLLNALNRDQHTVHYKDVWTSPIKDFPVNTSTNTPGSVGYNSDLGTDFNFKKTTDSTYATDNLIAVFKDGATYTNFKGGKIWTNDAYPAVALYEQVEMTPVVNSNGTGILYESYEVLDNNNIRLMDWVSPLAVFDPELDMPVPGYAGKIEVNVKNTTTWTEVQKSDKVSGVWDAKYGNWEFVYSAGMAIFNADYTPTRYASAFATDTEGVVKLRWTGFLYTGSYLDSNVALHDKQIKNMFAGATLPDSTNINNYTVTGITRITNSIAGTKPPVDNCAGFLQVMDVDHDDDTTADKTKRKIRQIIYPDNKDDATPYSRVGIADTLTGTISWSEWTQMGGGSLRRVVVNGTASPKTINPAQNNVLYESFGNNIFVLPAAASVPVGTRIGIEQFVGKGTVSCDGHEQVLEQNVPMQGMVVPVVDAISYIFECALANNGTTREWILDVDQNFANAFTSVNTQISDVVTDLSDEITRAKEAEAGLSGTIASTKATLLDADSAMRDEQSTLHALTTGVIRQTKHLLHTSIRTISSTNTTRLIQLVSPSTDDLSTPAKTKSFITSKPYNLFYYDLIVSITATGNTFKLPANPPLGAKVTFELASGLTTTITDSASPVNSESFTAESGTILVLEFEFTRIGSANGWTLLSLA